MNDATTLAAGPDVRTTRFRVAGMDCGSCAAKVGTAARRTPGVQDVAVSVTAGTMTVTHDRTADLAAMARTVTRLGYAVSPHEAAAKAMDEGCGSCCGAAHGDDHGSAPAVPAPPAHAHRPEAAAESPWWQAPTARLAILSGAALLLAFAAGLVLPDIAEPAFLLAMLVGLVPIARRAILAATAGSPFSIETLMTVAAGGAAVIGAAEEAAVVVFLFLVGELLEGVAAGRARAGIRALADLVPRVALVETAGGVVETPAARVPVGAVLLVRPGDRIAADGEIVEGASSVDEAPVTGESVPAARARGDRVFAGTVNGEGLLRVRVTAAAEDNTIARIVRLVEEAQEAKAPTERFIDRFARWYTPAVVAVGAMVAVLPPLLAGAAWGDWVYRGLAVLLIGCPCALVISTPAAVAAGLSSGARRGLLMKGGVVLERLGGLTVMALDKTGTLTHGRPQVTDVLGLSGRRPEEALALAAALEAGSSHPLATAILKRAAEDGVPACRAEAVSALAGKGVAGRVGGRNVFLGSLAAATDAAAIPPADVAAVEALSAAGKSVVVVVEDGAAVGVLALRDEPRPDARRGLDALRRAGVSALMLTGDNARTAEAVAGALGIDHRAGLMPEDKQRIVRELQAGGARVGKVGDGINDAPALAAADVGIAMGGGTDVALETADAAILHGRVTDLADMVLLSRAVMANIRQNIAIALGLKGVFLVTTIAGITGLWPAVLADTGATVLVTANAIRLLGWKGSA